MTENEMASLQEPWRNWINTLHPVADPVQDLKDCQSELIKTQQKLIEVLLEERKKCHCSK